MGCHMHGARNSVSQAQVRGEGAAVTHYNNAGRSYGVPCLTLASCSRVVYEEQLLLIELTAQRACPGTRIADKACERWIRLQSAPKALVCMISNPCMLGCNAACQ